MFDPVGFATPWLQRFSHQSSREHLCMGIRTSFQLPNCKLNGFDLTTFFLNGSESKLHKFCEQEAVSSSNFAVWELKSLSWKGLFFMSWDFLFNMALHLKITYMWLSNLGGWCIISILYLMISLVLRWSFGLQSPNASWVRNSLS